jgi:hypothetical protein
MPLKVTYSHAAPFIRQQVLAHADLKLSASTQRERRYEVGVMYGLTSALQIMMQAEDTKELVVPGRPKFRGSKRAIDEVKRYLGGEQEWAKLGFDQENDDEMTAA